MKITDLLENDLSGWKVIKMIEVYNTDADGSFCTHVGCLMNQKIAAALAKQDETAWSTETQEVLVLTNGQVAFRITDESMESLTLLDEKHTAQQVREKALSSVSPEEQAVLSDGQDQPATV